jgi:hypothetical protein
MQPTREKPRAADAGRWLSKSKFIIGHGLCRHRYAHLTS